MTIDDDKLVSAALCVYHWNEFIPHKSDAALLMTILHDLCRSDELDIFYKGFMREQGLDEYTVLHADDKGIETVPEKAPVPIYRIRKLIGMECIKSKNILNAPEAEALCKFCAEHKWPVPKFNQTYPRSNEWIPTIDEVYVSGAELEELKEGNFFIVAGLRFYSGDGGVTLICR